MFVSIEIENHDIFFVGNLLCSRRILKWKNNKENKLDLGCFSGREGKRISKRHRPYLNFNYSAAINRKSVDGNKKKI